MGHFLVANTARANSRTITQTILEGKNLNFLVCIVIDSWKKTKGGDLSTSGTTVACAIVQQDRIYIANVGDSTIVLGKTNPNYGEPGEPEVIAEVVTRDHKPEDKKEKKRIERLGGSVSLSNKGVMRVVWVRKRPVQTKTRTTESCQVDRIPFLSVARSLGDLWSVTQNKDYLVSPLPDVYVHYFDLTKDKFIILASDGLWNMLKPQETVETVYQLSKSGINNKVEASKVVHVLIKNALERWNKKNLTADNVSALIGFFKEQKREVNQTCEDVKASDIDEGIDLEVSTPSPSEDEQHRQPLQKSIMLHNEHLSDLECDSLQASCNLGQPIDSTKQKLGKRANPTDCLPILSPKKASIDKPPDILTTAA